MALSKIEQFIKDKLRIVKLVKCSSGHYWYDKSIGKYYLVSVRDYNYLILAEIKFEEEKRPHSLFEILPANHNGHLLYKQDCKIILKK